MAFGQTRQQEAKPKTETTEEKTEGFAWPWIPLKAGTEDKKGNPTSIKGGLRRLRLLPALDAHGNLIEVPATDRYGNVRKGVLTTVPETEVRFVEVWWMFMVNGKEQKRNIRIDWQGKQRWDNPLWAIANETDKGSEERKAFKEHFCMNVVDKSFVVFDDKGYPVYADEKGKFVITALGTRLDTPVEGDPQPLNQIRILQGTSGRTDPPGKHFYQDFVNLINLVENDDDSKLTYQLHEFDITVNVSGYGKSTSRPVNATNNRKPLPDSLIYAPRYDLATWAKPWPNEAIQDLLDGKDYYEVMKAYDIQQYPQLKAVRTEEMPFDDSVPAESVVDFKKLAGKKVTKKTAAEEESDELFN
jgi:hypothetical protein